MDSPIRKFAVTCGLVLFAAASVRAAKGARCFFGVDCVILEQP
jgi:hypothetical protein